MPWVSVPSDVHLASACSRSAFVACSLHSAVAPGCGNPTFTVVICLMLSAASPSSSFHAAWPPHLSFYSFSLYPEAEPGGGCLALSPHASSPATACAASSSPHCYLWLTCAPTQGLFISLLVIHRVWGALQMNRSHNCSVLEQPSGDITVFALLCLLHQFIINFCVLLGSLVLCFNSRSCCAQLYLAVLSGSLYLPGTHGLGRVA